MSWINPIYVEHQRQRWLRPDWQRWMRHDAHRFAPPNPNEHKSFAARRIEQRRAEEEAALAAEHEALDGDIARLRWMVADLKLDLAMRRLRLKYEGQPRDERGRYAEGRQGDSPKDPGLVTRPAFLMPPVQAPVIPMPIPSAPAMPVPNAVRAALALYARLSDKNSSDSRAVLGFNAGAFLPGADKADPATHVGMLNQDEVGDVCPRYVEVQSITNEAAASPGRGAYPTAQAYGTAVHTRIRDEINGPPTDPPSPPRDPDFRSELSVIKSKAANYGDPGSKRVDVYENPHNGTICGIIYLTPQTPKGRFGESKGTSHVFRPVPSGSPQGPRVS